MALKTALIKMVDEALCDVSKTKDDDYRWPKLDNVDDKYILELIKVRGVLAGVFKIYAAKSNRTTKETGEMAEIATTLGSLFNFMHSCKRMMNILSIILRRQNVIPHDVISDIIMRPDVEGYDVLEFELVDGILQLKGHVEVKNLTNTKLDADMIGTKAMRKI